MTKNIKNSLAVKIFLLVSFLLIAAGGITYAAIAHFLPVTYSNRLEEDLDAGSQDMAEMIESFSSIEEAETAIELFEAGSRVSVTILDAEGNYVRPSTQISIAEEDEAVTYEGAFSGEASEETVSGTSMGSIAGAGDSLAVSENDTIREADLPEDSGNTAVRSEDFLAVSENAHLFSESGSQTRDLSALKQYELNVGNERYVMFVSGGMQPVNQAVDVLKEIFPYILGLSALTAFLAAWGASFYLTAPVVSLSRLSRKMAVLDFTDTYQGKRTDEIGTLGRSLNVLSQSLSKALTDLRGANVNLQTANAELGIMNRKLQAANTELGTINEKLERSNADLKDANARMQRMNEKLGVMNDRLRTEIEMERELDRQRLAFFSAVSHELKTPVTILEGHLTGMIDRVGAYRNREYYLCRSRDIVRSMGEMVRELLTVSKMESREPKMQKTDLAEQLRTQLAELAELMESRGLELAADIPEHCYVEAEPLLMEKVFRNLLINAVRYTPEHAGNQIRVWMRLWNEKDISGNKYRRNGLYVRIENTGTFLPEGDLPHLFEAFYRVEQSRSRRTGGSGLGLYIVKMALERHGAQYGIRNTVDGVEAWFYIRWG